MQVQRSGALKRGTRNLLPWNFLFSVVDPDSEERVLGLVVRRQIDCRGSSGDMTAAFILAGLEEVCQTDKHYFGE